MHVDPPFDMLVPRFGILWKHLHFDLEHFPIIYRSVCGFTTTALIKCSFNSRMHGSERLSQHVESIQICVGMLQGGTWGRIFNSGEKERKQHYEAEKLTVLSINCFDRLCHAHYRLPDQFKNISKIFWVNRFVHSVIQPVWFPYKRCFIRSTTCHGPIIVNCSLFPSQGIF